MDGSHPIVVAAVPERSGILIKKDLPNGQPGVLSSSTTRPGPRAKALLRFYREIGQPGSVLTVSMPCRLPGSDLSAEHSAGCWQARLDLS
jgi:hypothetical protein